MTNQEKRQMVKRTLWNSHYRVRDMGHVYQSAPFDLIVEGAHMIVVGDMGSSPNKRHVYAVVTKDGIKYTHYKGKAWRETSSHIEVFGLPARRAN